MIKFKIKLEQKQSLAPKIYKFVFSIVDEVAFTFEAGQFIALIVAPNTKRYYSIASAPVNTSNLELLVDTSPGGPGSVFFENIQPGAIVDAMGPFGQFVYKSKGDACFVATGTGIAPFRSIILDQLQKGNKNNLTLIWGLRHEENVYLKDELEALAVKYPNFKYIITLTEPSEQWQGTKGRVTSHLGTMQFTSGTTFYLCGIKGMVIDAKDILTAKGLDKEDIFSELY